LEKSASMKLLLLLFVIQSASAFAQIDNELPAIANNNNSFFISVAVCKKFNLEAGQTDEYMRVYNSPSLDAGIQRVTDIRWQGKDKAEAMQWYKANTKFLSEDGDDITNQMTKPTGADSWNIYGQSDQTKKLMKAMGVEQNQYNFTFTVDKYVAKIFVSTSVKETLKDAWQFAKEGLKATLIAAGKPEMAKLVL
jgi:hypothetical protein